jgi:hypothetical protein
VGVHSITDKLAFIESVFGKGHLSGNSRNFDIRCPICAPSDPSKKKLSILTVDDRCHCWVCGFKARSLAPLIRKYGTEGQLAKYREMFGGSDSGNTLVTGEATSEVKLELPSDFQLLALAPESDPDVKATWRYVYSRGLDDRDVWYFKFGVSNETRWKRRVLMPSFDSEGRLNYFTARAIDKDRKPKYDNPEVDKNPIVFNEINIDWSKRLMLVEGPFDLVKCPDNTTALLGSDLDERHELFNKILLNGTSVWLALDGDMWYTKTPKISKKLQEYNIDVKVVDIRPWGDPGSMSRSEIESALKDATEPTWESSILTKLQRASQFSLKI